MRLFLMTIGIVLALGNPVYHTQAEDLQFFRIGTGGIAGTYYPIGGMIAHAISNPPGALPCEQGGSCGPPGLMVIAQSSNGSVANVRDIHNGHLESGFVQSDIAYWAYTGTGTFEGEKPYSELRTIANLYQESIHIVVRKGSDIEQIRDLVGKRVSLDEPGSGTLIDAELVLDAYGITRDDIEAEYMKAELAIRRIRENKLDAFFVVAGYPARAVSELANDIGLVLLPINGPEAERLVSRYRFFTYDEIPRGTYSGVAGIKTISVGAQWLVGTGLKDELVYEITRTLWNENSRKLLDSGHAKGGMITLETALRGLVIPLHPGARQFYNEIGLVTE